MIRDTCKYAIFDVVDENEILEKRLEIVESLPTTQFIRGDDTGTNILAKE
jgi:hypothetical protein